MGPKSCALFVCSFKRLSLKTILRNGSSPHTFAATRGVHQKIVSQSAMLQHLSSSTAFAYTAGRWLHLDKLQRDARYLEFNLDCLYERVLSLCPSATSIKSCQKLEGGFSRAFVITTNNGRQVVAKFPTSVAGPARYVTNSEVATITYSILDWCDDPTNPIGSAYIIMEHAGGVQLQEVWADVPVHVKVKIVGAICFSILPISQLDFPAYGRPDLSSYASALIDVGFSRLPPADHPTLQLPQASYQGSLNKHLELLNVAQALFPKLIQHPKIQSNATPTLFHPDLHMRNIFVSKDDPTTVTGFIDWQCTSVEPSFYYADDVPDFAMVPTEETPENATESLCGQAYEGGWALLAPRLGATRKIDESLLRPFRYCHRTWRDGFVPFTHELMRLRDRWKELGFTDDDNCPIPPLSEEDMRLHEKQLDVYEKILQIKRDVITTLGVEEDGWVSADRWEGVRQAHRDIYETVMASMEDDQDREELKTFWPFDDYPVGQ
ncbi:predicted protein [Histoplasma mississippiense (nom. inval.)]|uniref:predicted protein n=1 Tax=Ajellomyces capsulatus (strain NAm1 / WU24) TaxID=2059318 RepID=UPI000157BF40|nr:predicted protein [Histoplasma mississippiense (nom. inval.)]EDN06377.1 predicted protein [Histoplasma mississippiense (nom. inval.)]